jgi:hypothetical protein
MLKLIRECTPRLNWKIAALIGGIMLIGLVAFGLDAGSMTLLGTTPLLAMLVCLLPCAIPLLLLRRSSVGKKAASAGCAASLSDTPPRSGTSVTETR